MRRIRTSPISVADLHHLDRLWPMRGAQLDDIALLRLHQGAGDRGNPADATVIGVDLVDPDDGDRLRLAARILVGDGRAKEDAVEVLLAGRVDHLGDLEAL